MRSLRPQRSTHPDRSSSAALMPLLLSLGLALTACSDAKKRKIGASCESAEECASGLCYQQLCLDPDADPDRDGLVNRLEAALGTDPDKPDTDADGVPDKDEVDADFKPVDTDGDGTPDCLESRLADADQDCIDDEHDPDALPSAPAALVTATCPAPRGACAAPGATLTVACKAGLESPTCVYAGVPDYQSTETTCDALDNDCDGETDEGCVAPIGTAEHPAASCLEMRDAQPSPGDGTYWLDPDGAGPAPAFQAVCDLTRAGGGWTLVYAYTFTAPTPFDGVANAVTPIPTWRDSEHAVPVSTTPPTLTTTGAVDYALWPSLGGEFLIDADHLDLVACLPGRGSLVDGTSGSLDCRTIETRTTDCPGTFPNWIGWHPSGPMFANPDLWLYFDSSITHNWPTHDPCAQNRPPSSSSLPTGGRIWLRPTDRQVERPRACDEVAIFDRNLPVVLDPDGPGGAAPAPGQCAYDLERGDWTLMTPPVRDAMAARPGATWEYLLEKNGLFYRSPTTSEVWDWTAPLAAPGLWVFHAPTREGAFQCLDNAQNLSTADLPAGANGFAAPRWGIGCAAPPDHALPGAGPNPKKDPEAATTTVCQLSPNALSTNAANGCQDDVRVWTRETPCPTDPGGLLGDGGLARRAAAEPGTPSCWNLWGPSDGFAFDEDDVPPGGSAPSLAVTNDALGNDIWAYILNQQRLTFIAGRAYRLGFWAKAEVPRPIRVFVQTRELDHAYYWEDLALDTTWRYFELAFDADVTSWDAMIDFQLAEFSTATVWLDDIALSDTGPTPCTRLAPELLADPGFDAGRACWRFGLSSDTSLARVSREDGALRLDKLSGPADDWSAVVYQRGVKVTADRHYRFVARARASAPRDLFAALTDFDHGLGVINGTRVALDTEWRTLTFDFIATQSSDDAAVQFAFGNSTATIWLDSVSLVDLGPNPCTASPPDLIADPGFDAGTLCWWANSNGDTHGRYTLDADHPAATTAPSLKIENLVPENQLWDVQLIQRGFHIDAGKTYQMRFWARSEVPRTIAALVHIWDTNTMFVYRIVNLTSNWQEFTATFPAPTTEDNVLLELQFGQASTAAVWVDDVRLLEDAPVAHWPFDEGQGTTAHDVIGPHEGTVHGATWVAECVHGGCLRFAGADWVDAPATQIPWGAAPRTLALFFKSEKDLLASTESALCQWGTSSNTNMFGLITSRNDPGRLYFFGYNADLSGGPVLTQDTWHHAAVTYEPGDSFVRLYLDGEPIAAQAIALGTTIDTHGVTIGWRPDGGFWTGLIDDVRIYDRALSPSEIQALSTLAAP